MHRLIQDIAITFQISLLNKYISFLLK